MYVHYKNRIIMGGILQLIYQLFTFSTESPRVTPNVNAIYNSACVWKASDNLTEHWNIYKLFLRTILHTQSSINDVIFGLVYF